MTHHRHAADVGVLGAGIMGCCLALELSQRGYRVDLLDLAPGPMTSTSLHNEGKLHLGFVYAHDPLRATHGRMLRGSLAFSRILGKLTGTEADAMLPSQPFQYFVPRGSLLDMAALEHHFQAVEDAIREHARASGDRYLGRQYDRYFVRNSASEHSRLFATETTLGSFSTQELSVAPGAVAAILSGAVHRDSRIRFIGNAEILAVHRQPGIEAQVESRRDGRTSFTSYPCVVNCLWEDKLRIDQTAGIVDAGEWILRYKAMIKIAVPGAGQLPIPSATGILGAYGDVVNHGDGTFYLSWYPLCKLAQSTQADGRGLHRLVHKWSWCRALRDLKSTYPALTKAIASLAHRRFINDNIRAMASYIPSLARLLRGERRFEVRGGVILARGRTDIDDPQSYLHQRSAIGAVAYGSYITIDTGKYCTAPMIALEAADLVAGILS